MWSAHGDARWLWLLVYGGRFLALVPKFDLFRLISIFLSCDMSCSGDARWVSLVAGVSGAGLPPLVRPRREPRRPRTWQSPWWRQAPHWRGGTHPSSLCLYFPSPYFYLFLKTIFFGNKPLMAGRKGVTLRYPPSRESEKEWIGNFFGKSRETVSSCPHAPIELSKIYTFPINWLGVLTWLNLTPQSLPFKNIFADPLW